MKPPHESNDDVDQLTEMLLGSFREDVAPNHAKKATLAMLGLAGTATVSTISVGAGAASALSGMAKVSVLVVAKAVASGALVGAVVVGTSSYLQTRAVRETRAAATSGAPSGSARPVAPTRDRVEVVAPSPRVNSEGEAVASAAPTSVPARQETGMPPARASAPPPSPGSALEPTAAAPAAAEVPPPGRASSLAREIALLDESRAALARGNASEALRILDRYGAEVGQGALAPEATVLRIEALVDRHEPRAARDLAEAFERAHPNDSHLSRIRSLLARVAR